MDDRQCLRGYIDFCCRSFPAVGAAERRAGAALLASSQSQRERQALRLHAQLWGHQDAPRRAALPPAAKVAAEGHVLAHAAA
jgi:hypothetical protein